VVSRAKVYESGNYRMFGQITIRTSIWRNSLDIFTTAQASERRAHLFVLSRKPLQTLVLKKCPDYCDAKV
jgi:hypothetical protein